MTDQQRHPVRTKLYPPDAENQLRLLLPDGADTLIVAELHSSKSDPMSDYWAHDVVRTVVIGVRKGSRDSFAQFRKAAAGFAETAHLGPEAPKDVEHRENFTGGCGNCLKDGFRHHDGWTVRSADLEWLPRCFEVHLPLLGGR